MLLKIGLIALLAIVIYSLGSALVYLIRGDDHGERLTKALTWRVALSLILFIVLFLAYYLGWISPHTL